MTALDAERLAQGVRNTLQSVIPRLKDLHQTLIEPAKVAIVLSRARVRFTIVKNFFSFDTTLGVILLPI